MAKSKSKKSTKAKPTKKAKMRAGKTTKASSKKKAKKVTKPAAAHATAGAIVGGTIVCVCGYSPEEHGRDAAHPGWTGCSESGCESYEADHNDDESDE